MKLSFAVSLSLVAASLSLAYEKGTYVISNNPGLALYGARERTPNTQAKFRVSQAEQLLVVSSRGKFLRLKTADGKTGWVERWFVKPVQQNQLGKTEQTSQNQAPHLLATN